MMYKIPLLIAALAVLSAPALAGSPDFNVSLYSCSEYAAPYTKAADNCIADPEDRLALIEAIIDDGGDNSEGDPGDDDE